jgi:hypothetical protein
MKQKTAPPENPMALYDNQRSNDCDIARSVSGLSMSNAETLGFVDRSVSRYAP